jgi:hypothetical protein
MKKIGLINKVFEGLSLSLISSNSCNSCMGRINDEEEKSMRKSLLKSHWDQMLEHKDAFGGDKALSLHLEPQVKRSKI